MEPYGEKKSGANSRKKKLVGSTKTYVYPDPIFVEVSSYAGERRTRLTFAPPIPSPEPQCPDRIFAEAIISPEILVDPALWFVIKPWLKNTPQEVEAFWKSFNTPEAIQERLWNINGDKSVTWQKERALIQMVRKTQEILSVEIDPPPSTAIIPPEMVLMTNLAEWVMNAVEKDPESLRRLHTLLKNPEATKDLTNRERINRSVFEAFARTVAVHQRLPSKKQVRKDAFIRSDEKGRNIARRAFSELGLSGLPKA